MMPETPAEMRAALGLAQALIAVVDGLAAPRPAAGLLTHPAALAWVDRLVLAAGVPSRGLALADQVAMAPRMIAFCLDLALRQAEAKETTKQAADRRLTPPPATRSAA